MIQLPYVKNVFVRNLLQLEEEMLHLHEQDILQYTVHINAKLHQVAV